MKKLFVWDFHGVLEKGTEAAVFEISNRALRENGYQEQFTKEFCDSLYGQKWFLYFKALMPELDLSKCHELQNACLCISEKNPDIMFGNIKPHHHAHEVIKTITEEGHQQILISNTGQKALDTFLGAVNMSNHFDFVFAADTHHGGKHLEKVDILKEHLKNSPEQFDEIIAIDDNISNISFKRVENLKFVLYRHAPPFPECDADVRTHELKEVLNFR